MAYLYPPNPIRITPSPNVHAYFTDVDWDKVDATTEEEVEQQAAEDDAAWERGER